MTAITTPGTGPVAPTSLPADGDLPVDGVRPAAGASPASRTTTTVALSLWVFVSGLLVYGIAQTAMKAAALFG